MAQPQEHNDIVDQQDSPVPDPQPDIEEEIEVLRRQGGEWVKTKVLCIDDPHQKDVITKQFAHSLGYPADAASIKPLWAVPNGRSQRNDQFEVVESAAYKIIVGQRLLEKIAAAKRTSPMNLLVVWCLPRPTSSREVVAQA